MWFDSVSINDTSKTSQWNEKVNVLIWVQRYIFPCFIHFPGHKNSSVEKYSLKGFGEMVMKGLIIAFNKQKKKIPRGQRNLDCHMTCVPTTYLIIKLCGLSLLGKRPGLQLNRLYEQIHIYYRALSRDDDKNQTSRSNMLL